MAKKQNKQPYSDVDKLKHYSEVLSDPSSSARQCNWAKMRIDQLSKKLSQPAPTPVSPITDKCCAESAGLGFGRAKSGQRVLIDVSVQDNFRNGVKRGRSK